MAVQSSPQAEAAPSHHLRALLQGVSAYTLDLYASAKERSPEAVRARVAHLEEAVLVPYGQQALAQWRAHGDPLVDALDARLADSVVPKVNETVTRVGGKVQEVRSSASVLGEQVNSRIAEKVVKPYGDAREQLTSYTKANRDLVEQRTHQAVEVLSQRAYQAIDYVLPEEADEGEAKRVDDATNSVFVEETKPHVEVVSQRLSKRYSRVAQRALVLRAEAREVLNELSFKYFPDEDRTTNAFARVIEVIPSTDSTQKAINQLVSSCPPKVAPYVNKGALFVQPAVDYTFDRLVVALLAMRRLALAVPRSNLQLENAPSTKPCTPAEQNAIANQDQQATAQGTENIKAPASKKGKKSKKQLNTSD